jgi:uncharacterized protein (AIM24 family)
MPVLSIREFVASTADVQRNDGPFELETDHVLQIHVDGQVWTKAGSMIAYRGAISFEREGLLERGVGQLLKKAISGEGGRLTRASGRGSLYLADRGKRVTLVRLDDDVVFVNGNDLLAFEPSVQHDVTMMRKMSAIASGGLFNVRLSGRGIVAITTHHRPTTLAVRPGHPVFTDPQATVAWSGSLEPSFKTDIQMKTLLGRGSGESFQMKFEGDGFVIVQPYEEDMMQAD